MAVMAVLIFAALSCSEDLREISDGVREHCHKNNPEIAATSNKVFRMITCFY